MSEHNIDTRDQAEIDATGLATVAGWLTVYAINPTTREYTGTSEEYLPVGVGLPAFSFMDKPAVVADSQAIVRNAEGDAWDLLPDYRGNTAYSIETGAPIVVTALGELDNMLTLLAPATGYDKWNGTAWVTDETAEHAAAVTQANAQRATLITEASARTQLWQTQLLLNIISDTDKTLLTEWMRYIQELQTVDTAIAPDINWPDAPL
ncbi:tail fiber assembly protein [Sodalis sp. RH24]|uniref:tail fiber assembly protein n=1 Tax=unclassified Sodalis (in: enterobacteria) TaxID=2636512 RepID=UPI0039B61EA3